MAKDAFRISLALVCASLAIAQTPGGKLRGHVYDPSRAAIAGATVTVVSANLRATTGEDGSFDIDVPPGSYSVTVIANGFMNATDKATISGSAPTTLDFVLPLGEFKQSVTVVESPGYQVEAISTSKVAGLLRDTPQSITVIPQELIKDQQMLSMANAVLYVPGAASHQGENNRDEVILRGVDSSANFYENGVRDDVQYYRDLYNSERIEALKGPAAMVFGRGGGGGVINRVTKEAGSMPLREITLQGGSFNTKRFAGDVDQPFGENLAFRLNGVYENSGTFRDFGHLERYALNPTFTILAGKLTRMTVGYEYSSDQRVADRGIPSFQGLPLRIDQSTYFGDPKNSPVHAAVNVGTYTIEHQAGGLNIHDRFHVADYDRGYQNFVPGAVTPDGLSGLLTAYNNATRRRNIFNQTDLTYSLNTGRIRHTLMGGSEVGRQLTDNFRNTGFFNNTATSITIPLSQTVISTPVTWRQSATDADNHLRTNLGALYLQDQIELNRFFQAIVGIRFDYFDLQFHNNRTAENFRRIDNLVSPRAGLVFKPITAVSLYASYSVSYLPSSGDQFSSLTTITAQVKPEKFTNYEVGAKWSVSRRLTLNTALYRLDRTNTRSTDPNDPTRIIQTGSQRTNGFEAGLTGSITRKWSVTGGYAYQDAFITSATTAAVAGRQVGQVPHNTFSLWNNYRILPRLSGGLGLIQRSSEFVAVDNTVRLPGYVRADAALFYTLTERARIQVNVENLTNNRYIINADSNTNISPGSPRAVRAALTIRF
jgi:catecholate siderophore receptor